VQQALASPPPPAASPETAVRDAFRAALTGFRRDDGPVLVMGHNDADGLSAAAIFVRALRAAGWAAEPRILGRGENPWSAEMAAELAGARLGGLVVTDLGVRPGAIKAGTPTVVVDHHVPRPGRRRAPRSSPGTASTRSPPPACSPTGARARSRKPGRCSGSRRSG
jgi:hypothetical protein